MKKKRYIAVRMPQEAYNNFVNRKIKMERVVKEITNKSQRVPLTEVFKISSRERINLPDEELIKIVKKGKRKNAKTFTI